MARFRCGQIIWAYIDDGKGHTKDRPCMILTRNSDLRPGDPIQVVAITTDIGEVPRPYWVSVPNNSKTGLSERCVAKCNWIREIPERRIIRSSGDMPDDEFEQILECFDRLESSLDFDDWI